MECILKVDGVSKQFGGLEILKDLSFHVNKGERIGIIGPNGAGKSTFFNLLTGDLAPSKGNVFYKDKDITTEPNYKRARRGIVRTFQKNNLLVPLTVLDNLLLVLQRKHGISRTWFKIRNQKQYETLYNEADELLQRWGLKHQRNVKVESLSYGEQRQIEIMLGVATNPDVLLLDEPTAGMSQSETNYIVQLLHELPKDLTLMIIEHDLEVIFGIAERMIVLYDKHILIDDSPDVVRKDPQVNQIYIGTEGAV
ncbi:branched-chain amino acid transport system ATP-binding protein [Alteribacillus persepolensis]|uniref:Branched-chain amino acid transport system ATP-binding protein n=1 Tax=Alteribacillus persepolensis TaxID=568899 RepID=A0A1G8GG17_9BACI|nr:ABC transporter ATP-binding protein [Alteribacillus persepolensis]SDH93270.1 branched-chain amino acid transport system ATP-binding protein [Alteribacillus persepolensis]